MDKRHYLAVFEDGTEHYFEVPDWGAACNRTKSNMDICQIAVYARKLTTSRKDPQSIKVQLFRLEIEKGNIKRNKVGEYKIQPPLVAMNAEEYKEELQDAVEGLPVEFQEFVKQHAWGEGHSYGYEEVVSIANNMASELTSYVERYTERLRKQSTPC